MIQFLLKQPLHALYFTATTPSPEPSKDHDGITSQSSCSTSSVESSYVESSELLFTKGVAISSVATTDFSMGKQKSGRIINSIHTVSSQRLTKNCVVLPCTYQYQ